MSAFNTPKYLALVSLKNKRADNKKAMDDMLKEEYKEFPEKDTSEILQCFDLKHQKFINAIFNITPDHQIDVKYLSDIENNDSTARINKMLTPLGLEELDLMERSRKW